MHVVDPGARVLPAAGHGIVRARRAVERGAPLRVPPDERRPPRGRRASSFWPSFAASRCRRSSRPSGRSPSRCIRRSAPAVAWIPGRNDSLLAVFSLAAWLFFLRDRARPSRVDRALHLGLFALALLTKETAVALPLVWLLQAALVDAWPGREAGGLRAELGPGREPGAIAHLREPGAIVYLCGWVMLVGAAALVHHALSAGANVVSIGALARNLPLLLASLGKVVFPLDPTVLAAPEDLSPWPGAIAALGIAAGARWVHGVRPRVVALGLATFALLLVPVLAVAGDARPRQPTVPPGMRGDPRPRRDCPRRGVRARRARRAEALRRALGRRAAGARGDHRGLRGVVSRQAPPSLARPSPARRTRRSLTSPGQGLSDRWRRGPRDRRVRDVARPRARRGRAQQHRGHPHGARALGGRRARAPRRARDRSEVRARLREPRDRPAPRGARRRGGSGGRDGASARGGE